MLGSSPRGAAIVDETTDAGDEAPANLTTKLYIALGFTGAHFCVFQRGTVAGTDLIEIVENSVVAEKALNNVGLIPPPTKRA